MGQYFAFALFHAGFRTVCVSGSRRFTVAALFLPQSANKPEVESVLFIYKLFHFAANYQRIKRTIFFFYSLRICGYYAGIGKPLEYYTYLSVYPNNIPISYFLGILPGKNVKVNCHNCKRQGIGVRIRNHLPCGAFHKKKNIWGWSIIRRFPPAGSIIL